MPDKKALLNPCVTPKPFSSDLIKPTFLFVGQTIDRKGISCLLEACSLLDSQGIKKFSIVIIGDGEQREKLEELTCKKNLGDRVHWVGWIEYGGLGWYFENADAFVFPTLEDIWGMVVLEAMLFSKPILCSKWAGAKEMVSHGENGFIFDPFSPEELAGYMQKLIQEPELIQKMGERSQQLIQPHNPLAIASHLAKIVSIL
jgi:glycosyltransferase involved in cell wall biosynthesis